MNISFMIASLQVEKYNAKSNKTITISTKIKLRLSQNKLETISAFYSLHQRLYEYQNNLFLYTIKDYGKTIFSLKTPKLPALTVNCKSITIFLSCITPVP